MEENNGMTDRTPGFQSSEKSSSSALERTLQVISVTFVLTYISGYLVTSTFLNSFGIAADASDFLKARYLYVGFLYLLFLAGIGMALGFLASFYDHVRTHWIKKAAVPLDRTPVELRHRYLVVWAAAGFFFATSEAAQIMILSPQTFRDFILFQTGLLAAFLFYQLTNARALHHPGWDQDRSIFQLRAWTVTAIVIFAALPFVFLAFKQIPVWVANFVQQHSHWTLVVFNLLLLLAYERAIPFFYTGESLKKRLDPGQPKQRRWEGIGPVRALLGAILFSLANIIVLVPYGTRWEGLQWANLILASAALASVIFLSIAYSRDRKQNGEKLVGSDFWMIWLLRVTTGGTLYVASTILYANILYPNVPFGKSGGDFMTASVVRIHFQFGEILSSNGETSARANGLGSEPAESSDTGRARSGARVLKSSPSKKQLAVEQDRTSLGGKPQEDVCTPGISTTCTGLVILEETPDIVYFARLNDAVSRVNGSEAQPGAHGTCGPRLWTSGIQDPKWPYRPHLIAVNRKNVVSIEETEGVLENKNCQ